MGVIFYDWQQRQHASTQAHLAKWTVHSYSSQAKPIQAKPYSHLCHSHQWRKVGYDRRLAVSQAYYPHTYQSFIFRYSPWRFSRVGCNARRLTLLYWDNGCLDSVACPDSCLLLLPSDLTRCCIPSPSQTFTGSWLWPSHSPDRRLNSLLRYLVTLLPRYLVTSLPRCCTYSPLKANPPKLFAIETIMGINFFFNSTRSTPSGKIASF
ncbi:hypothetical protein BZA77DRAFT_311794 [Pyronema omphalodes]|nr:hypothetical protein BZA77DRAFT_311794 [Pyronema omphalodes]